MLQRRTVTFDVGLLFPFAGSEVNVLALMYESLHLRQTLPEILIAKFAHNLQRVGC
jgi:hypothetical protein